MILRRSGVSAAKRLNADGDEKEQFDQIEGQRSSRVQGQEL
jgi:hypothetical protein